MFNSTEAVFSLLLLSHYFHELQLLSLEGTQLSVPLDKRSIIWDYKWSICAPFFFFFPFFFPKKSMASFSASCLPEKMTETKKKHSVSNKPPLWDPSMFLVAFYPNLLHKLLSPCHLAFSCDRFYWWTKQCNQNVTSGKHTALEEPEQQHREWTPQACRLILAGSYLDHHNLETITLLHNK